MSYIKGKVKLNKKPKLILSTDYIQFIHFISDAENVFGLDYVNKIDYISYPISIKNNFHYTWAIYTFDIHYHNVHQTKRRKNSKAHKKKIWADRMYSIYKRINNL